MNITEILFQACGIWGVVGLVFFMVGGGAGFFDRMDNCFDKTLDREKKIRAITNTILIIIVFGPIVTSFALIGLLGYLIYKFSYHAVYWLVSKFVK